MQRRIDRRPDREFTAGVLGLGRVGTGVADHLVTMDALNTGPHLNGLYLVHRDLDASKTFRSTLEVSHVDRRIPPRHHLSTEDLGEHLSRMDVLVIATDAREGGDFWDLCFKNDPKFMIDREVLTLFNAYFLRDTIAPMLQQPYHGHIHIVSNLTNALPHVLLRNTREHLHPGQLTGHSEVDVLRVKHHIKEEEIARSQETMRGDPPPLFVEGVYAIGTHDNAWPVLDWLLINGVDKSDAWRGREEELAENLKLRVKSLVPRHYRTTPETAAATVQSVHQVVLDGEFTAAAPFEVQAGRSLYLTQPVQSHALQVSPKQTGKQHWLDALDEPHTSMLLVRIDELERKMEFLTRVHDRKEIAERIAQSVGAPKKLDKYVIQQEIQRLTTRFLELQNGRAAVDCAYHTPTPPKDVRPPARYRERITVALQDPRTEYLWLEQNGRVFLHEHTKYDLHGHILSLDTLAQSAACTVPGVSDACSLHDVTFILSSRRHPSSYARQAQVVAVRGETVSQPTFIREPGMPVGIGVHDGRIYVGVSMGGNDTRIDTFDLEQRADALRLLPEGSIKVRRSFTGDGPCSFGVSENGLAYLFGLQGMLLHVDRNGNVVHEYRGTNKLIRPQMVHDTFYAASDIGDQVFQWTENRSAPRHAQRTINGVYDVDRYGRLLTATNRSVLLGARSTEVTELPFPKINSVHGIIAHPDHAAVIGGSEIIIRPYDRDADATAIDIPELEHYHQQVIP